MELAGNLTLWSLESYVLHGVLHIKGSAGEGERKK